MKTRLTHFIIGYQLPIVVEMPLEAHPIYHSDNWNRPTRFPYMSTIAPVWMARSDSRFLFGDWEWLSTCEQGCFLSRCIEPIDLMVGKPFEWLTLLTP